MTAAALDTTPRTLQGSDPHHPMQGKDAMTRAVGYLRVSTGLQAEKGMGLEIQRERVSEYAQAQGLELVDVIQEVASGGVRNGEEASSEHRPVLLALLDRDDFDVLIVARYDRLSRDVGLPGVHRTEAVEARRARRLGG